MPARPRPGPELPVRSLCERPRDGAGLARAGAELDRLGDGPLATVARAVVAAADARHESRGCHWRADYPHTSEQWLRRVVVRLDDTGRPIAWAEAGRVAA